jgi:hypothetical protein
MIRRTAIALVILLGLLPVRDARATTNAELAEMLVQMVEQLGTVVSRNMTSCDTMGDALEQYIASNQQFIQSAKGQWSQIPEAEQKALMQRYQARLQAAQTKIVPGLTKCRSNQKVVFALKQADGFK